MRKGESYHYEFDWETVDKDDDIQDHDHFFGFDSHTTKREAKAQNLFGSVDLNTLLPYGRTSSDKDGEYRVFVLVRDLWEEDEGVIDRAWVYLNKDNELTQFFDGSKIPAFVKEFFKIATTKK
tara:strand:+ start:596 stop:964 length:369 start_codon:yes stop_codon:yes gene_type:complete